MADLKPCPFCGGARIFVEPDEYGSGGQWVTPIHVGCSVCKAEQTGETKAEAFERWNHRAPDPRLAAQLRECADTLGADQIDEQRAMRAYADSVKLLEEMQHKCGTEGGDASLKEQ